MLRFGSDRLLHDALCSRGSLCGLDMSVLGHLPSSGGVWIRPSAFWAIFPEVPPCGGKEPRMTCQFGQDCHCTSVWLTVLRKLIPPLTPLLARVLALMSSTLTLTLTLQDVLVTVFRDGPG